MKQEHLFISMCSDFVMFAPLMIVTSENVIIRDKVYFGVRV